jgi:hypothetical protein
MKADLLLDPAGFPAPRCDGFTSDRERRALARWREEKALTPDTVVLVSASRRQLVTFGQDAFLIAFSYGWGSAAVTHDLVGPPAEQVDAAWIRALYRYPVTWALEDSGKAWRVAPLVGETGHGA